jgi:hypothetical protein
MKKLIFLLLLCIPVAGFSQGLFKPVSSDMFQVRHLTAPEGAAIVPQSQWQWRFDATVSLSEVMYNKVTKALETSFVGGIGPAIGYQHFVPTSSIDPTPFNNYGISAALLMGERAKIALQANIMQYFKFGITYTLNPLPDMFVIGLFFGGGITF